MAYVEIPGGAWCGNMLTPTSVAAAVTATALVMDANTETVQVVGTLRITGKATSVAFDTNSKIIWRTGTGGTYDGADTLEIGIQDVDAATGPPGRGDGTYDVTSGAIDCSTITNATTYSVAMASGTKTLSHGDKIAIVFTLTRAGTSNIRVQAIGYLYTGSQSTAWPQASNVNVLSLNAPCPLVLDFEGDGTVLGEITVGEVPPVESFGADVTYGSGTEHGMVLVPPVKLKIDGFRWYGNITADTVNTEIILYKDTATNPATAVATLATLDGDSVGAVGVNRGFGDITFPPQELDPAASSDGKFAIMLKPSGSSITLKPLVFNAAAHVGDFFGFGASDLRGSRTTGAISTTAKEQFWYAVRISAVENGAGGAGGGNANILGGSVIQ